MTPLEILIIILPSVLLLAVFALWYFRFSPRARVLRTLKGDFYKKSLEGRKIKIVSTDPTCKWTCLLTLYENTYMEWCFEVPKDHDIITFVGEDYTWDLTTKSMGYANIDRDLQEILDAFLKGLDDEFERLQILDKPLSWSEIHTLGEAVHQLESSLGKLEPIQKLEDMLIPQKEEVKNLCEFYDIELRKKYKQEDAEANWIQVEEGPAKGYEIAAIPLEEGDYGDKLDKWKGISRHPISKERMSQTRSAEKEWAVEAIREVVEIEIEEGTLDIIGDLL